MTPYPDGWPALERAASRLFEGEDSVFHVTGDQIASDKRRNPWTRLRLRSLCRFIGESGVLRLGRGLARRRIGNTSRPSTCGLVSRSSAASSIVMTRSSSGMNAERTPRSVVLPEPVPPETTRFALPRTHAARNASARGPSVPPRTSCSGVNGTGANFRTLSAGPQSERGETIACTRELSESRPFTQGDVPSTWRPKGRDDPLRPAYGDSEGCNASTASSGRKSSVSRNPVGPRTPPTSGASPRAAASPKTAAPEKSGTG
jgi:hypothetical protein